MKGWPGTVALSSSRYGFYFAYHTGEALKPSKELRYLVFAASGSIDNPTVVIFQAYQLTSIQNAICEHAALLIMPYFYCCVDIRPCRLFSVNCHGLMANHEP